MGWGAGRKSTTAERNTFIGAATGYSSASAITGSHNTGVGNEALHYTTDAHSNVAVGAYAFKDQSSGSEGVAIGTYAATNATGSSNVCVGFKAGENITSGTNNICIGKETGRSSSYPGGDITTGDNYVVIGNGNITNSFIKVDWTVGSDIRDKTDIVTLPSNAGLNFVNQLRPVTYVWDNRDNYYDFGHAKFGERDHSKKATRKHTGFIAQEVKEIEESIGWGDDHIVDTSNEHSLALKYSALIPILTKAIQELSAKVEALENG